MCFLVCPSCRGESTEVVREETSDRSGTVCFLGLLSGLRQGVCRRVMAHVRTDVCPWTRERNSIRFFAIWSKPKLLSFLPRMGCPPKIVWKLTRNATHVRHCIRLPTPALTISLEFKDVKPGDVIAFCRYGGVSGG